MYIEAIGLTDLTERKLCGTKSQERVMRSECLPLLKVKKLNHTDPAFHFIAEKKHYEKTR